MCGPGYNGPPGIEGEPGVIKITKEICELLEKYDFLEKVEQILPDDFFDQVEDIIEENQEIPFNKLKRVVRKRKINKINKSDEKNS